MNRSQDDIQVLKKVNMIVKENLPGFASRYFSYNMDLKTPRTLYGYALDLKLFFEYLEQVSCKVDKMTIKDLETITPDIIENYLEFSYSHYDKNGDLKKCSDAAVKRKYCVLSSFFSYFYRLDMIATNAVDKVQAPRQKRFVTKASTDKDNKQMLEFVAKGSFDGFQGALQEHTRNRDLAIIMLIMGAGLKVTDCVELNISDLHLDEHYIEINRRKKKKNVYISDKISQTISNYLSERLHIVAVYGDDDALFLSLRCRRICTRTVQVMLKRYSEALFGKNNNLTSVAINLSFRDRLFDKTMNVKAISDIFDNDRYTIYKYYQALVDEYECHKGEEFTYLDRNKPIN